MFSLKPGPTMHKATHKLGSGCGDVVVFVFQTLTDVTHLRPIGGKLFFNFGVELNDQ
jgi:hypothetical protein